MKRAIILPALLATFHLHAQTITEYRYWINDDPATVTTASIGPAPTVLLSTTLDLPPLTKDFNTITVQFKDGNGEYSVPKTTWFTKNSGVVNGYEYWIDDAIAASTTGAIGPGNVVDLIADLPTGTSSGTHLFTIRFGSVNGGWSVPLTSEFSYFDAIPELPGISDVLLFPNPVTDALGLRLNTSGPQQLDLQLLDAQGRLVRSLPSWTVSGSSTRNWDMADLASGSYLLRISDGNGVTSLPFIKQ